MKDWNDNMQRPLRELVYLNLKRKILTGEFPPHMRLMEVELAEEMNVSRTPIREAVRTLASEGLVQIEGRHGSYVAPISMDEVLEIFEVRENLEGIACYYAAQRMDEEDRQSLLHMMKMFEGAADRREKDAAVEWDTKLHQCIVRSTGNNLLYKLIRITQELSMRLRYTCYEEPEHFDTMKEQHRRLIQALFDGDAERAQKELRLHIRTLRTYAYEGIKRGEEAAAEKGLE